MGIGIAVSVLSILCCLCRCYLSEKDEDLQTWAQNQPRPSPQGQGIPANPKPYTIDMGVSNQNTCGDLPPNYHQATMPVHGQPMMPIGIQNKPEKTGI